MFEILWLLNALILLWIVAAWMAVAFYTATVASAMGYRYGRWLIGGLVFSLVALIAAAGLPESPPTPPSSRPFRVRASSACGELAYVSTSRPSPRR